MMQEDPLLDELKTDGFDLLQVSRQEVKERYGELPGSIRKPLRNSYELLIDGFQSADDYTVKKSDLYSTVENDIKEQNFDVSINAMEDIGFLSYREDSGEIVNPSERYWEEVREALAASVYREQTSMNP